jgi:hypothetical protein
LPSGIPGIGDEIDGAMQHAPQPARQENSSEAAVTMSSQPCRSGCAFLEVRLPERSLGGRRV